MTTKAKTVKSKTKKTTKSTNKASSDAVLAKSADGTIQITFTIPWKEILQNRTKAAEELGKNLDIPGFRKGKAPLFHCRSCKRI